MDMNRRVFLCAIQCTDARLTIDKKSSVMAGLRPPANINHTPANQASPVAAAPMQYSTAIVLVVMDSTWKSSSIASDQLRSDRFTPA